MLKTLMIAVLFVCTSLAMPFASASDHSPAIVAEFAPPADAGMLPSMTEATRAEYGHWSDTNHIDYPGNSSAVSEVAAGVGEDRPYRAGTTMFAHGSRIAPEVGGWPC